MGFDENHRHDGDDIPDVEPIHHSAAPGHRHYEDMHCGNCARAFAADLQSQDNHAVAARMRARALQRQPLTYEDMVFLKGIGVKVESDISQVVS
jgi:hypothetical protein